MKHIASLESQISGMDETKKSIAYAFPSSYLASRYNGGKAFFYIEINSPDACSPAFGEYALTFPANRFDTVADAEKAADNFPFAWWYLYRQYPLRGSRFFPGNLSPVR